MACHTWRPHEAGAKPLTSLLMSLGGVLGGFSMDFGPDFQRRDRAQDRDDLDRFLIPRSPAIVSLMERLFLEASRTRPSRSGGGPPARLLCYGVLQFNSGQEWGTLFRSPTSFECDAPRLPTARTNQWFGSGHYPEQTGQATARIKPSRIVMIFSTDCRADLLRVCAGPEFGTP